MFFSNKIVSAVFYLFNSNIVRKFARTLLKVITNENIVEYNVKMSYFIFIENKFSFRINTIHPEILDTKRKHLSCCCFQLSVSGVQLMLQAKNHV